MEPTLRTAPWPSVVAHGNAWILFSALLTMFVFLTLGRGFGAPGHA
jgi:hypothetical protein